MSEVPLYSVSGGVTNADVTPIEYRGTLNLRPKPYGVSGGVTNADVTPIE